MNWRIIEIREKMKITLLASLILFTSSMLLAKDMSKITNSKPITIEVLQKATTSWNGEALPSHKSGKPEISILKISVAPHTKLPIHKHPMINTGVILSGELTVVTDDNQTKHFKAGDSVVEVVNRWHHGQNDGNVTTEIIIVYVGVEGEQLTIVK